MFTRKQTRATRRRHRRDLRMSHRTIRGFTAVSVWDPEARRMRPYKGPRRIVWPVVHGVMALIRAGYHESVASDHYFRGFNQK